MFRRHGDSAGSRLEAATEDLGPEAPKEASRPPERVAEAHHIPEHRSFLRDLRFQDWLVLLGLLAVLAALILGEQRDAVFAQFLAGHALLSGFMLALLLSLIAIGGLDALRAHWEAERWRKLSSLAMLSIAYDVTIVVDTLIWLVIGVKPTGSFEPPESAHEELTHLRDHEGFPRTFDSDYGNVRYPSYSAILNKLADNPGWLKLANQEIDRAKVRHRRSVALWVPSMMLDPNTTDVMNRVAAFNEFLSYIQKNLRTHRETGGQESHSLLVGSWIDMLAEGISLREDLWATSRGRPEKPANDRKALPCEIQNEMQVRDAEQVRSVVVTPLRGAMSRI